MAMAVSVSNKGRQLVCSICQKTFEEMTLSSCFHTFCLDCLKGQVSSFGGTSYRCPICKASVNLPGEVIHNLKSETFDLDDKGDSENQTCDICSDGRRALYRCMQCEENLCNNCANAHLKMKASRYHRQHVVPLAGQSAAGDLESLSSQKNCWRHRNEEIKFVCKKCDVVLCLICKLMEHENHVTKPISEEAYNVRRQLSSLLQKQIGLGEKLQIQVQEMESRKTQYPLELEHELTKLNYQASQIHAEIENEKQKAEKELKLHFGENLSKYETDGGRLKQDYETYKAANTEALQLLNSKNDVYVVGKGMFLYDRLNKLEDEIGKTSEMSPRRPSKQFQFGSIDTQQLHSMMGYVSDNGSQMSLIQQGYYRGQSAELVPRRDQSMFDMSTKELELHANFVIPFIDGVGYVYGIAPVNQTQAWITLLDHEKVRLVDTAGNILSSVDVGDVCEDVTTNQNGDCFITCPRTKCVKYMNQDGQVEVVLSQLQQDPHGISLLQFENPQDGGIPVVTELYVCFTDKRGSDLTGYHQKGCLRVFSENGEDLGKSVHLQAPVRVDVHQESNSVCVSDHCNGCVTISDMSGQIVRAIYTGEDDDELFKPLGVCFDSRGNVIIADWGGNKVSLVSQEGVYLTKLISDIEGPQSVAFKDGLVWVGGIHGNVYVYSVKS